MIIRHVDGKFCVVDVQPIILIPDEAPMEAVLGGIRFEGIELVLYLSIDVLVLAFGFTALGLNHPHRTVFLHYDVVSIEQPLMLQAVQINDGEILLPGIAILVDPIDIIAALTILLKQLLRCAADEGGGVAGGVLLIGIGKVLDFFLYTGIVFEKILNGPFFGSSAMPICCAIPAVIVRNSSRSWCSLLITNA